MRKLLLLPPLLFVVSLAVPLSATAAEDERGTLLAESTYAGSLTAGPDGNVWFSAEKIQGEGGPVVGKVTLTGEVTEYGVPDGAGSIVAGTDGNLWFSESKGIARITPGGEVTSFPIAGQTGSLRALTAGPGGNVWFVSAKPAAGFVTPAGAVTKFPLKTAEAPSDVTAGPSESLWFTEPRTARVGRVTVSGKETEFRLPTGSRPNSIALGTDGNLWFSDRSAARVGRITPRGQVTFFPVPTLDPTDEVLAGPDGVIWFTAGNEIGRISTSGRITWPGCFTKGCQYPPEAMTIGPDGRLWVASGIGHCPGYCGGGSGLSYSFEPGGVGPSEGPPPVTVGIGPRLSPVRKGLTSVVVGCGESAPCKGTLRLRALTRPHGNFAMPQLSRLAYSLAPGQIETLAIPFPQKHYSRLHANGRFLIVEAIQGGEQVAHRGFYFDGPKKGGVEKHFS